MKSLELPACYPCQHLFRASKIHREDGNVLLALELATFLVLQALLARGLMG